MRSRFCLIVAVLALLLPACTQEQRKTISDLFPLRDALIKQYQVSDVGVQVQNGRFLSISFVNSAFNQLPRIEQETKAKEIATFAKAHYASTQKIEAIGVSFVVHKNYVFIQFTNALNSFFFKTSDLPDSEPGSAEKPSA